MNRLAILTLMITTLSYGQVFEQITFNPKSKDYLNKSFGVLHQKDTLEKLIPIGEFEKSMQNTEFINPKQSINATLYSKANSENTIRLDSLSTVNFNNNGISGKIKRRYDENGRQTLYIYYNWDADSATFIPSNKSEYTYDENGNVTLAISYNWDADSAAFIPSNKSEYTYDERGYQKLNLRYNWDIDSATFNIETKIESTYNDNGLRTSYKTSDWDTDSDAFKPSYEDKMTYDDRGRRTYYLMISWLANLKTEQHINYDENDYKSSVTNSWKIVNGDFIPSFKNEYAHDKNNNVTVNTKYIWDADSAAFLLNAKNESAYEENNEKIGYTVFSYNNDFGVFYPTKTAVYEFDNQMRVISEEQYDIDICNNEKVLISKTKYSYIDGYEGRSILTYRVINGEATFLYEIGNYYQDGRLTLKVQIVNPSFYDPNRYSYKYEYVFNENGNETLYVRYVWDAETESLVPSFKRETSYDEDYNLQEEVYSNWYPGLGIYKLSTKKEFSVIIDTDTKRIREGLLSIYDTDFNQWNTLTDQKYHSYWYYTKSSTLSSESFNKDTNIVFPNPAGKFLKVKLSDSILNPFIEIFDIAGKKVFSKKIQSGENINVSSLAPAVYVYKIKDGSTIKKSGKIIKE